MTGAVQAAASAAASNSIAYKITVGANGSIYGYLPSSGPTGACAPTPATNSMMAISFLESVFSLGTVNLRITLDSDFGASAPTQSFFRSVTVQNSAGNFVTLNSSAATFSSGAGFKQWDWTGGSNVWDASATGVARSLIFNF